MNNPSETKQRWEKLRAAWEMRTLTLISTRRQLTAVLKPLRLLKNWATKERLGKRAKIWEIPTTTLVSTRRQLTAIVKLWRLLKTWATKERC